MSTMSLTDLLQRIIHRYGQVMTDMLDPQATRPDLGGWDGTPPPTPAKRSDLPTSSRATLPKHSGRIPSPHTGYRATPKAADRRTPPVLPPPPPPRAPVTTHGPGGNGIPLDLPPMPLPPEPPPEDDTPWAIGNDIAEQAGPSPTMQQWQAMRDRDPLLQPGTPLGDLLRDPTTRWPCAVDLGNDHIIVAKVDIEGCAPTMRIHQGRTQEQWEREDKTPTCSHFTVIDCM
jgi:hypothetical protein